MRIVAHLGVAVLAAATVACGGSAADHERLGDRRYDEGRYHLALNEYRAAATAGASARIWAKLGAAATAAGNYTAAAEAYRKLAAAEPSRATEAADGLERAARAAVSAGDQRGVRAALVALRAVAPTRGVGRLALSLTRGETLGPAEAVALLPYAIAASPDAGTTDSLVYAWGAALQQTTACDEASSAYRAVLRRSRDPRLRRRAAEGLALCSLQLGLDALTAKRPEAAEQAFRAAIIGDSASERSRRALMGVAEAKLGQGDLLGAAITFEKIIAQNANDSIGRAAAARLRDLGNAGASDSIRKP